MLKTSKDQKINNDLKNRSKEKMNFKKYQHIEKLGTTEVEGILEGQVSLFYKIDGTNSCIFLKDDNTLGFGSRTRELTLDKDNGGFYASILFNKNEYNKY